MIFFYGLREFWRNKVGFNNWKANIWLQFLANFSKLEHIFARNCNRGIFREHLSLLTNDSLLNNSLLKNIFFNAVNLIILQYNVSINRRREKEYITLDKNYQKISPFILNFFLFSLRIVVFKNMKESVDRNCCRCMCAQENVVRLGSLKPFHPVSLSFLLFPSWIN